VTGWNSRIVGHGEVAPTDLVSNPRNWRKHPKAQLEALTSVLDQVGWVQDVIVNKRTGLLVDGHARLEIAMRRKEARVPVVYVDLDPDEEALILASLDPLAAMAEADSAALDDLLAGIVTGGALAEMLADLNQHETVMAYQPTEAEYVENPIDERNAAAGDVDQATDRNLKPFVIYIEVAHATQFKEQLLQLGTRWGMNNPSDVVVNAIDRQFRGD
jgi:hypothetical protein